MSDNEMEVDLERIWYWPQIWLAEPGWEKEGTAFLDGVPVRSVVRTVNLQPECTTEVYTRRERMILEVGTERLLRHDPLNEDGSLSRAIEYHANEVFEDPAEVPPEVWLPTL